MSSSRSWFAAASLAGIGFAAPDALAINPTTTWTGGTNSDWSTGSNWNNGVPDASFTTTLGGAGGANQPRLSGASSSGTLNMNGTGNTLDLNAQTLTIDTLNLSAGTITNNAASGATLSVGTLNLTGGMLTGTGTGGSSFEIAVTGSLTVNRADNVTIGNVISGAGGLIKSGAGTLTLGGVNTYTGGTVVNAGTLLLGVDNALAPTGALILNGGTFDLNGLETTVGASSGSAAATVKLNGGALTVGDTTDTVFAGIVSGLGVSGPGIFAKQGTGRLTLTGTTDQTIVLISQGTLQLGVAGGAAGTINGIVLNAGTLDVVNGSFGGSSFFAPFAEILTVNGTTTFRNTTSAGNTVIAALGSTGSIVFRDSSSAGTALVVAESNGSVFFLDQASAGAATLAVATGSTIDFSGLTVDTTVGALLGVGGTFALGGRTLTVGGSGLSSVVDGVITGTGGLIKVGSGDLALIGTNTYSGPTTVSGGRLLVDGSITSAVTVNSGGTVGGSGTITGNVTNNGIIAPGSVAVVAALGPLDELFYDPTSGPIGTLTIAGNYTQGAGATYQVELDTSQNDRINVSGTASLAGMVSVTAAPGLYRGSTTYTILNAAGGRSGSFAGATTNRAFLQPSLSYDANNVFLTITGSFATGGRTGNQQSVGRALDQALPTVSGDFANVLAALQQLDTVQGPRVLDVLGGANYSAFSSLMMQSSLLFMNGFSLHAGGGGGTSYQALKLEADDSCASSCDVEPLWGVWGGGVGAFGTVAGDSNASGVTYNLGGFVAGLDRRLAPNFRAGVAAGFNGATLYTNGMPGTGTSNTVQFAIYGEFFEGPFYLDALAGYAHSDNRQTRPIVIPGLPFRSAQGFTQANTFFGQLEAGYKLMVAESFGGFVTPFARLQGVASNQAAFSETGADSLNLNVAAQTTNALRTVLGAQVGAAIDAPWREKLNVMMRVGWSHEYADTSRPVSASFAGAPALGFTVQGAQAPRDGAVVGFGANTQVAERTNAYLRYDGDLAGGNTNHVLSAGVRYVW